MEEEIRSRRRNTLVFAERNIRWQSCRGGCFDRLNRKGGVEW